MSFVFIPKLVKNRLNMLDPSRWVSHIPSKKPDLPTAYVFFRLRGAVRYWLLRIHNLRIANDTLL